MPMKYIFYALSVFGLLFAQDKNSPVCEKSKSTEHHREIFLENQTNEENDDDEILVSQTKAVILYGDMKDIPKKERPAKGLIIKNLNIPGSYGKLKKILEPIFYDKPLTKQLIEKIKHEIIIYYRSNKRSIVTVLVPPQEITYGVLHLIVIESRIEKINVEGNKYFTRNDILKNINLYPGDMIDIDKLLSDVAWMNRNPFRAINVLLSPGEAKRTTDIDLIVRDRYFFRPYMGGENSGTRYTSRERLLFGFNFCNPSSIGNLFSYQFTSSLNFHKYYAHTANYTALLPWKNVLSAYGGFSKVHPDIPGLNSNGKSAQVSLRYAFPIGSLHKQPQQDFHLGFDYKFMNNNLMTAENTSQTKVASTADLFQLVTGYKLDYGTNRDNILFLCDVFTSPWKFLWHQKKSYYDQLRPGAKPRYIYFKLGFEEEHTFKKNWKISFKLRGQASLNNLLPSEEFDLGGEDTVRGYENRWVNRDNAFCANLEIKAPPIGILKYINKKFDDKFTILTFLDFGYGIDHKKEPMDTGQQSLMGGGCGFRYSIAQNFSVKFDWGIPLFRVLDKDNQQIYLQAFLSY